MPARRTRCSTKCSWDLRWELAQRGDGLSAVLAEKARFGGGKANPSVSEEIVFCIASRLFLLFLRRFFIVVFVDFWEFFPSPSSPASSLSDPIFLSRCLAAATPFPPLNTESAAAAGVPGERRAAARTRRGRAGLQHFCGAANQWHISETAHQPICLIYIQKGSSPFEV